MFLLINVATFKLLRSGVAVLSSVLYARQTGYSAV